jgi:ElaB/YqjD/DUF883 family membrane-anchored ribosome-binding protein
MSMKMPETEIVGEVEKVTKRKLIEDLKTVLNDAEELLKKVPSDQTREWMTSVQSKAEKSLKAANDWLTEEEGVVTAKARAIALATEDYVRANTWMVLGIAAAAGVFIGVLAVRLGLSAIEGGKRVITQGGREIQDYGKRLMETGKKLPTDFE